MKRFLQILILLQFIQIYSFAQNVEWFIQIDGGGQNRVRNMITDSNDNIIVLTPFKTSLTIAHSENTFAEFNVAAPAGNQDLLLIKFDKDGNYRWHRTIGSTNKDQPRTLAIDNANNIYVSGSFNGSLTSPAGTAMNSTVDDSFLLKYASDGTLLLRQHLLSGTGKEYTTSMVITPTHIVFTGYALTGTFNFHNNDGAVAATETVTSGADNYIAKYSHAGDYISHRMFTSTGSKTRLNSINRANDGGFLISGPFYTDLDIQVSPTVNKVTSNGLSDIALFKTDANLNVLWTRFIKGAGENIAYDAESDTDGNVYLAGSFTNTINIDDTAPLAADGDTHTAIGDITKSDKIIAKFSDTGNLLWSRAVGTGSTDDATAISIIGDYVQVGGKSGGVYNFSGVSVPNSGSTDMDALMFDKNGKEITVFHIGGTDIDVGKDVIYTSGGESVITGFYRSTTIDIGAKTLTAKDGAARPFNTLLIKYGNPLSIAVTNKVEPKCFGDTNGSIETKRFFGLAPFTITWYKNGVIIPGETSETLSNIGAGNYMVKVEDGTGKETLEYIELEEPEELKLSIETGNIKCSGDKGYLIADVTGGTTDYTYNWSKIGDPAFNSDKRTVLDIDAGDYSIVVTDKNGCVVNGLTTLTTEAEIAITSDVTQPTSQSSTDGAISITNISPSVLADGATNVTYTVNWSDDINTVGLNVNNLRAGKYFATVTQNETGCSKIFEFKLGAIELVTREIINVSCNGLNNGSAKVEALGGEPPYEFSWKIKGSTTYLHEKSNIMSVNGLVPETYEVTVSDNKKETSTIEFTIAEPTVLAATVNTQPVSCFNSSDGKAVLTVSGGNTGTKTYNWTTTDGSGIVDGQIYQEKLGAGSYNVTISDPKGCDITKSFTIDNQLDINLVDMNISQPSENKSDGSITITVAPDNLIDGNDPRYLYMISKQTSRSREGKARASNTFTGLSKGMYDITVINANNCRKSFNDISLLSSLNVIEKVRTDATCYGYNDGIIEIEVEGGVKPYTIVWRNETTSTVLPGNTTLAPNLIKGDYSVSVTDAKGTVITKNFAITEPEDMVLDKVINGVTCHDSEDGSVSINVTGGNSGIYKYKWLNDKTLKSFYGATQSNMTAGTYTLTISDSKGCEKTEKVDLNPKNPIEIINETIKNQSDITNPNGEINITATGGSGTLVYSNKLISQTNTTGEFIGLKEGEYTVNITDENNCILSKSYEILNIAEGIRIFNAFTPNGDGVNDLWNIENIGKFPECEVIVYNSWGNKVFYSKGYKFSWDGTQTGKQLPAGVYYYSIKLNKKSKALTGSVTIIR